MPRASPRAGVRRAWGSAPRSPMLISTGRLDVAVANGHVHRNAEEVGEPFQAGKHNSSWAPETAVSGMCPLRPASIFARKLVGRGLTWADFDNGRPAGPCFQPQWRARRTVARIARLTRMPGSALNWSATAARVIATRLARGSKLKATAANRSRFIQRRRQLSFGE